MEYKIKKISEKPNLSRPDTSAIKKKAKELKKLTGNTLIDDGDGIEKVLVHTRGPIKNPGVSHPRGNGKNPRTVKEKTSIYPDRVVRTKIKTDGTVIKTEENVGQLNLFPDVNKDGSINSNRIRLK